MEWRAPLDRIWTESATLGVLRDILPEGTVPQVLFEDRPNYLFAMTCAADDAVTWKSLLMDGLADPAIASRLGTILGTIHSDSPSHPALRGTLADTSLFEELRVDPYYRTVARRHPDLAPRIEALIAAMDRPVERTHAGPRRLQPQEHPGACRRACPARLRMRPRRRPGLRPRLLPDAPRPQGDPRGSWRVIGRSMDIHRPDATVLGLVPRASGARARAQAELIRRANRAYGGLLPGSGRRQEPGRVPRRARPGTALASFARRALRGRAVDVGRTDRICSDGAMEEAPAWPL